MGVFRYFEKGLENCSKAQDVKLCPWFVVYKNKDPRPKKTKKKGEGINFLLFHSVKVVISFKVLLFVGPNRLQQESKTDHYYTE